MQRFLARVGVPGLVVGFLAGCGQTGGYGAGGDVEGLVSEPPIDLPGKVNNHGTAIASDRLELRADDVFFEPTFIEAQPGARIRITVRNVGQANHSFTAAAVGVDETVEPGATRDIDITVVPPGLEFTCRFHSERGMRGAVYVPAGRDADGRPQPG